MKEVIIFCNPADVYRGLSPEEVDQKYRQMAISDFDAMLTFHKDYEPYMEIPDFIEDVATKDGSDISLVVFAKQPITRVENINKNFTSSSYLFNPLSRKELMLPDLDVIQLAGTSHVDEAANVISNLYQSNGWKTIIHEGSITDTIVVNTNSSRFFDKIEIINPSALREIAKHIVCYDMDRLSF